MRNSVKWQCAASAGDMDKQINKKNYSKEADWYTFPQIKMGKTCKTQLCLTAATAEVLQDNFYTTFQSLLLCTVWEPLMSDHSVWTWQLEIGIKSSSQNNYVKGADRYISLALKANQTKTYIRRQSHTFFPFRHGSKGSSRTSQTLQLLLVICLLCVNLIARTGVCVCVSVTLLLLLHQQH